MRIGLINITKLTRVRDTFKPGWRIIVALTFLLSVFLWLAALHQLKSLSQIVDDATIRMRTLILTAVVLPPLAAAMFSRNDFGRLFFALATIFNLATIAFVMLVGALLALTSRGLEQALAFFLLVVLFMLAAYQLVPSYLLLLSLIPFGRWKAYRRQVTQSLRLWSGEWKGVDASREVGPGEKPYLTPGGRYRLALGWLAFAFGALFLLATLASLINSDFLPAVRRLEISRAWRMLSGFQTTPPADWPDMGLHMANTGLVLLLGIFCFFLFGFFLTQWRRENVSVYRLPLLQHMTPSDLLLLRSFSDDVKYVARSKNALWMLFFGAYSWSFTFEELIVNRLKYLGRVRLIDVEQVREGLLEKRGVRFIAELVGRDKLLKLLISVFPMILCKLPAQGGVRHYIDAARDEERWKEEIDRAMSLARMVVVLLGMTDGLKWEMGHITEHLALSEKTLFVMPPLIRKKNYVARWGQFVDFACAARGCDRRLLEEMNPKRVLAAVVRGDSLLVITGKVSSQRFYESALDVAALLTVADPEQSGKLVPKYLK
jgi:hypothetical protein